MTKKKLVQSATIGLKRAEATALLSGIEVALSANGGRPPKSIAKSLVSAVKKLVDAFEIVL